MPTGQLFFESPYSKKNNINISKQRNKEKKLLVFVLGILETNKQTRKVIIEAVFTELRLNFYILTVCVF